MVRNRIVRRSAIRGGVGGVCAALGGDDGVSAVRAARGRGLWVLALTVPCERSFAGGGSRGRRWAKPSLTELQQLLSDTLTLALALAFRLRVSRGDDVGVGGLVCLALAGVDFRCVVLVPRRRVPLLGLLVFR